MGKTARLLQAQPIFTPLLTTVMLVTEAREPMKAILRSGFLALAIMLALMVQANAATERFGPFIYNPQSPSDLKLDGQIDPRSALNFRRALDAHPEIERLYLNSVGGSVQTALLIADDVQRAGIFTFIESNAECYSACAYIFFAGRARQVDGRLGVHQISAASGRVDNENLQINLSDIIEALNKYGVDPKVLEYMLRTSADEMYIFSQQEISLLSLNRTSRVALRPAKQASPANVGSYDDGLAAYYRGDYTTAARLWRQLAEQGHAAAQNILGSMYRKGGRGVPRDDAEAVKWYRMAVEQGDAQAQHNLGFMYAHGLGVPQDHAEAVKWYRMAVEQGDARAQNDLGFQYANGLGVLQDYAEAVKWFRMAAEQGDAFGQYNLGTMYHRGQGVPQDYAEAVTWYRKAAEQGHAVAKHGLGVMYANGLGVPRDFVEANMWYNLAAAHGIKDTENTLDLISKSMTPNQIAEAQRMTREWMAKHQR